MVKVRLFGMFRSRQSWTIDFLNEFLKIICIVGTLKTPATAKGLKIDCKVGVKSFFV